jgi:hypothetical protein
MQTIYIEMFSCSMQMRYWQTLLLSSRLSVILSLQVIFMCTMQYTVLQNMVLIWTSSDINFIMFCFSCMVLIHLIWLVYTHCSTVIYIWKRIDNSLFICSCFFLRCWWLILNICNENQTKHIVWFSLHTAITRIGFQSDIMKYLCALNEIRCQNKQDFWLINEKKNDCFSF